MNNPSLSDNIIAKIRTMSEVSQVLSCLEEFVDTFFSSKSAEDKEQIFRELPKEIGDILIAAFASIAITPENQISIKRQIDELSDKLNKSKSIQITIAFKPDDATIILFSDWVKKNVSDDMLIDLQFDKSIVGGAVLITKGVFKDYTVKKKLANRFQIQREDVMGLLD